MLNFLRFCGDSKDACPPLEMLHVYYNTVLLYQLQLFLSYMIYCYMFSFEKGVGWLSLGAVNQTEGPESRLGPDEHADDEEHVDGDGDHLGEQNIEDFSNLTGRQKRLFELRLKMVISIWLHK